MSGLFPNLVHIESVRDGVRDLDDVTWGSLWQIDPHWPRAFGHTLEAFAWVGRDLVILYPGLAAAKQH